MEKEELVRIGWENVRLPENGEKRLVCEIFGKRIG